MCCVEVQGLRALGICGRVGPPGLAMRCQTGFSAASARPRGLGLGSVATDKEASSAPRFLHPCRSTPKVRAGIAWCPADVGTGHATFQQQRAGLADVLRRKPWTMPAPWQRIASLLNPCLPHDQIASLRRAKAARPRQGSAAPSPRGVPATRRRPDSGTVAKPGCAGSSTSDDLPPAGTAGQDHRAAGEIGPHGLTGFLAGAEWGGPGPMGRGRMGQAAPVPKAG